MAPGQRSTTWNVVGWVLYVLLLPLAFYEFLFAGLAFGMSTDACYDAACDARHHVEAAIATISIGIVVVLVATAAVMIRGTVRGRNIAGWPFVGLLGLAVVLAIAMVVV